jgi:hypothetical protein
MSENHAPRGKIGWFVAWERGGGIFLVHSRPKGQESIRCPKCIAPMIYIGDRCACYACGMTFDLCDDLVRIRFGEHSWDDERCPLLLKYDPSKNLEWYEKLRTDQVKECEVGE